jgi:hypothetical protein
MNSCPACSQAVSPNDLVCPKCGISLHHGTAMPAGSTMEFELEESDVPSLDLAPDAP